MAKYKVETLIYYSKLTLDFKHIAKNSNKEIQEKLDEYSNKGTGWRLPMRQALVLRFIFIYILKNFNAIVL